MSGYPAYETFLEILQMSTKEGADFIEVGMPFSDPSADSSIIKTAGGHSLKTELPYQKPLNLSGDLEK